MPDERREEAKAGAWGARTEGMLDQSWAMFQLVNKQICPLEV